ncbi:MAG: DUF3231 family protein [Firmicutes bacterium]|nr:DUF3231 family protein [Bacillota bacterium]
MGISIFKKSRGLKEEIDIKEAYNIWSMMRARYHSVDTIQIFKDIAHDRDFIIMLGRLADSWNKFIYEYEAQAVKFKLKTPIRPPYDYRTSAKINQFTDRYIFTRVFNDIVAQLYPLVTAYRTTTTNDLVRKIILNDLKEHVQSFELVYKYGKLKGWMDEPPAYKTAKTVVTEMLTTGEAFHLLDHISHRYHQLQLTKFFLSFAHDKEFRLILNQGVKTLEKETEILQELSLQHEIQLPIRPPHSMLVPVEPETAEDSFMYQAILIGMQTAIDLHVRAVLETIRNDALRKVFYQLFEDELVMHENILKYGKAKGWIIAVPIYAEPV